MQINTVLFAMLLACIANPPLYAEDVTVNLEKYGLIELEAGWQSDVETSQLQLATVAFGAVFDVSSGLRGNVSFLYEQEGTPLDIDEAYLLMDIASGWSTQLGLSYLPFGRFDSIAVNDPMVLALGETLRPSAIAAYASPYFIGSVYVFSGREDYVGKNSDNVGVRLTASPTGDATSHRLSVDYIGNVLQSELFGSIAFGEDVRASGASVAYLIKGKRWGLAAEWLAALQTFSLGVGGGAPLVTPEATMVEITHSFARDSQPIDVGFGWQKTEGLEAFELPSTRAYICFSSLLANGASVSVDLFVDKDFQDNAHSGVQLQLAAGFD